MSMQTTVSQSRIAVLCGNEKLQLSVVSSPLRDSKANIQQEQYMLFTWVPEAAWELNNIVPP